MELPSFAGLSNWQWLYILEAVPAILLGFVVLKVLTKMAQEFIKERADDKVLLRFGQLKSIWGPIEAIHKSKFPPSGTDAQTLANFLTLAQPTPCAHCIPSVADRHLARRVRAGMPPATSPAAISPATILPAAITAPAPMRDPGSTVTRAANHAPSPISTWRGGSDGLPSGSPMPGISVSAMMQ